jgi:hypothetical protein
MEAKYPKKTTLSSIKKIAKQAGDYLFYFDDKQDTCLYIASHADIGRFKTLHFSSKKLTINPDDYSLPHRARFWKRGHVVKNIVINCAVYLADVNIHIKKGDVACSFCLVGKFHQKIHLKPTFARLVYKLENSNNRACDKLMAADVFLRHR